MHGMKLEPGHATVHVDCGLRKKQRDFFSVNLRLRSCVTVPAEPRRRWLGNRAVRGDLSAGLTS